MPEVVAIEWVVAIAVGGLLLGLAAGWGLSLTGGRKTKVAELERALEKAEEEMSSYRGEVYGQFAETAEKFRALDKSYNDLHRQLAQSSVALCGDAGAPLLSGPSATPALDQATQGEPVEKEVNVEAVETSTAPIAEEGEADEPTDAAVAETASEVQAAETADATPATESAESPETKESEEIVIAEVADVDDSTLAKAADDAAPAAEPGADIPTLTDTDATRRESA